MVIEGDTIGEIYLKLISRLAGAPLTSPRGMLTRELLGVQLRLNRALANVLVHPVRNLNYRFMVTEWLWILTGSDKLAAVTRVNSKMTSYSDDGISLAGAYGPRWLAQAVNTLNRLRLDPDTRRAVISFWRYNHDDHVDSRDVPCTLTMQLINRQRRLHAIVSMRSSDAWLGIPYDIFTFTMLLNYAASVLGFLEPGSLILTLGSSHLYEQHERQALELLSAAEPVETLRSPRLPLIYFENLLRIRDAIDHGGFSMDKPTTFPPVWTQYLNAAFSGTSALALDLLREINDNHDA
jgi:thymidylate synthase